MASDSPVVLLEGPALAHMEAYFERFVLGYICEDIERSIVCARANYLVALGLLSYTEFLGGLSTGDLGVRGKTKENFNAGLALMAWNGDRAYYKDFTVNLAEEGGKNPNQVGIYEFFRCGMVHEYFSKAPAGVHNNPSAVGHYATKDAGIEWIPHEGERVLRFHTNAYYRDFRAALESFRQQLRTDKEALGKFKQSVDRVEKRIVTETTKGKQPN